MCDDPHAREAKLRELEPQFEQACATLADSWSLGDVLIEPVGDLAAVTFKIAEGVSVFPTATAGARLVEALIAEERERVIVH